MARLDVTRRVWEKDSRNPLRSKVFNTEVTLRLRAGQAPET